MVTDPKKELLKQQLEEVASRTRKIPKGVEASQSTGIQFNAQLQRIVQLIRKDINEIILPMVRAVERDYTADDWTTDIINAIRTVLEKWSSPEFRAQADVLANAFVRRANGANRKAFNERMRSFGMDVFGDSPELQEYLAAASWDNAQLIKSIPDQYLQQVQSIVMGNVRAGLRPSAISKALSEQFGISERRAKMIARDQTAKINADLSKKRQQNTGFEFFRWVTSKDSRVRERHTDIANKITAYGKGVYRWDDPPLSDRGTQIIPGSDFQCRCVAVPVTREQVEQNQRAGQVRKGVKR